MKTKTVITADLEYFKDVIDHLLNSASTHSGKKIFTKRLLNATGTEFEIFGIKKDKSEMVVFQVKLTGPAKYRRYKVTFPDGLIDGI